MPARIMVITATGTNVGKTHVSCALLHAARNTGIRVRSFKPVATGLSNGLCEDCTAHARALRTVYEPPLYAFEPAIGPHRAARSIGVVIDLETIVEAVHSRAQGCDLLVVETAGGCFSPLNEKQRMVDLVEALRPCEAVLIAPDRLGVLHDVFAAVTAWRSLHAGPDTVVLSSPEKQDASTGTNAQELHNVSAIHVKAVFPWAAIDDAKTMEEARKLLPDNC